MRALHASLADAHQTYAVILGTSVNMTAASVAARAIMH